jgi:hypothetical protein
MPTWGNIYEGQTYNFTDGYSVQLQYFHGSFNDSVYTNAILAGYNVLHALLASMEVNDAVCTIKLYKGATLLYTWTPFFGHSPTDNISDRIMSLSDGWLLQVTEYGLSADPYLTFQLWYNNPQDPDNIYVNSVSGSDALPNKGTISLPVKTYGQALTYVNADGKIHVINDGADFTGELVTITKTHEAVRDSAGYFDLPGTGVNKGPRTLPLSAISSGLVNVTAMDSYAFTATSAISAFWIYTTESIVFKLRIYNSSHTLKTECGTFVAGSAGLHKFVITEYAVVESGEHVGMYVSSGILPKVSFPAGNFIYKSGDNSDMSSGFTYVTTWGLPLILINNG